MFSCDGCICISFNDPLLMVVMLNVFIYCITIKNITWYQSYHERSLCAAKTVLQLQLLKIRVSSLKTLKDQNNGMRPKIKTWKRPGKFTDFYVKCTIFDETTLLVFVPRQMFPR